MDGLWVGPRKADAVLFKTAGHPVGILQREDVEVAVLFNSMRWGMDAHARRAVKKLSVAMHGTPP